MLRTAFLRRRLDGNYRLADEWYEDELCNSISDWIHLHEELGYDDIEECEVQLKRSALVPDKFFAVDGKAIYALKQEGVLKVRKAKSKM